MITIAELRPVQRVESNELEPTPYPGATACSQQAATSAEPSQQPYAASLGVAETTLRSTARRTRPTTEMGAPTGIQSMEWALQGIKHRKKFLSTEADRTSLTELSCSSELQQRGNGSLWSSPTHLQPWKSSRRTTPGSWRLPASALVGPNTEPNTNISLELTLSLRVISSRAASPPYRPEDRYLKETPLMSFTPPSAHQAVQVHQRGVPSPLCSVFTVGPVLTVCSLLDPAGLFHPAALLGLRGP